MSAPLGAHEERNLEMVLRVGAGQRQEDPRAAAEWLTDWLNNGLLALNAFQGYFHMPRMGTENIKRLLFESDRSQVVMDLGAGPPRLLQMTLPWLCRLAGSPSSLQRPFHVVEVIAAHAQKLAVRVLRSDGRPGVPGTPYLTLDAGLWPG